MTKKYLANPFDALYLYQNDISISSRPEIQELNEYALGLEEKIEGDFNLDYIEFEFKYNRLAYIRSGLILAKLKFLRIYRSFGDGTFASFCRERLGITRWQINQNIRASRVAMELLYAGFEILPTNISQAMALASLTGDELVHAWRSVTEAIEPDKITHRSIRSFLFPPTLDDLPDTKIMVDPTLHESIHTEAAERGISIVELIRAMFAFFVSGGVTKDFSEISHSLKDDVSTKDYAEKERIWREDLKLLAMEDKQVE